MEPDVIMDLYGGLGNQLFQYAAALRALRETGGSTFELMMIEDHYKPDISEFVDVTYRNPTRMDRARWTELAVAPGPLRPIFRRTSKMHERRTSRFLLEQSTPFDGFRPLPSGQPVKLQGFFQHPEWWIDDWRTVVAGLLQKAPDGYEDLVAQRRTVISLRQRADYITAGWVLPPRHYDRILATLAEAGLRNVVVLSDEPTFLPWFRRLAEPAGFVIEEPVRLTGRKATDDFFNLAAGAAIAVPNSTFSFWAGAVATARGDTDLALYPKPWIVNRWTDSPLPDMGMPGWTMVPAEIPEFE